MIIHSGRHKHVKIIIVQNIPFAALKKHKRGQSFALSFRYNDGDTDTLKQLVQ